MIINSIALDNIKKLMFSGDEKNLSLAKTMLSQNDFDEFQDTHYNNFIDKCLKLYTKPIVQCIRSVLNIDNNFGVEQC